MKALILAAGYAVRLGTLTSNRPKPLLEINKRSMLDRILDKIFDIKEIGSIYIVTNNRFFENFDKWLKASRYKAKTSLINDGSNTNETRLGAIRDLELAIKERSIDEDLLVVAGDNLFDMGMKKFLKFAKSKSDGATIALHDIKSLQSAKNFGVINLDENDRVIEFEEKPDNPKSTLVSTGIYYFPKNRLPLIEEYVKMQVKLPDAPGYYISWASKMDKVYGYVFLEDWYDIGSVESYEKADKEYKIKEGELA